VASLVDVFRELRRVLKDDGTCWLNLGDSYNSSASNQNGEGLDGIVRGGNRERGPVVGRRTQTLKAKDLVGIPWRVAFALQADGWYLRSDIIWSKPNPMPESVADRPTKAHEYVFLLTKRERYYYDAAAISEPVSEAMYQHLADGVPSSWFSQKDYQAAGVQDPMGVKARIIAGAQRKQDAVGNRTYTGFNDRWRFSQRRAEGMGIEPSGNEALPADEQGARTLTRNRRTVWTITTQPYDGAHFATMPEALVEPCVLAGCRLGGLVLDPFVGSGTVLAVAERVGRRGVGTDLRYQDLARVRTAQRGLPFVESVL
jgi:DNA modification methylase